MSLFRSRKKSFNDGDSTRRPSFDDAPPMPTGGLGKYSFRRKKNQPEVKKEIDIATALPSTADFRTSLLMPNLSARFSMLREQDDPNTKVGKASDDSVLFPKRASRLNLFTLGDLADIAEVSSLSGSIKPPFARTSTYSSDNGYATDDDKSVMTRSRPGQGNKFFGGRQKIYMLSTKDGENTAGRPKGRAVYDDDINLAAFKRSLEANRRSEDNDADFDADYNSKRETSSSTGSGPFDSRGSTAATSVASNAPSPGTQSSGFANKLNSFSTTGNDRPIKGKRLYGQGLDQHMHEQQSSAVNRLNSIQRNFGPGMVHYGVNTPVTKSITSTNSSSVKPTPASSSGSDSASQGNTTTLPNFDFVTNQDATKDFISNRPFAIANGLTSPSLSSTDPTLMAALDANDLGKATATGAFNKPAGPYNDEQFAQRQLQLQQGRDTPPPRAFSRTATNKTQDTSDSNNSRERNGSLASQRSAFSFQSSPAPTQPSIREQSSLSNFHTSDVHDENYNDSNGADTASISGSEYESEPASPDGITTKNLAEAAFAGAVVDPALRHRKYEHDDQHPAFSSSSTDLHETHLVQDDLTSTPVESHHTSKAPSLVVPEQHTEETAPQASGLSDLVRGHLRNISNQSSVYPDSPQNAFFGEIPEIPEFPPELAQQQSFQTATSVPENPLAARARAMLDNANQLRNAASKTQDSQPVNDHSIQQVSGSKSVSQGDDTPEIPWQDHLRSHNRQGSTETQREREDFANELADRRKQVQSNLRHYVSDAQSSSARANDPSPSRGGAFGLLKKASFSNLTNRGDSQPKATKNSGPSDPQSPPLGYDSRNRFQNSKPSERTNRMAPNKVQGAGLRERTFSPEPTQNFTRKASRSPARAMDRSPPTKTPSPNPNGYGFVRASPETGNHQGAYHPAGRSRKYSPPNVSRGTEPGNAPYMRSASAQAQNPPPFRSATHHGSYFPPSSPANNNPAFNDTSRAMSPVNSDFYASPPDNSPFGNGRMSRNGSAPNLNIQTGRKGSINKSEISTPTFVSGTSSMMTVELPHEASLSNGMDQNNINAPPLPPINPRRRGQNFFTPFSNRSANNVSSSTPSSIVTTPVERGPYMVDDPEQMQPAYQDEVEHKSRFRNRLRKSSSAGENMSQRARHQALKDLDRAPRSPNLSNAASKGMF